MAFRQRNPPTVLALLDFSKAYNKVWRADPLATMLRKGVLVCFVRWIQGFLSNRQPRVRLNRAYSRSWVMREGVPQGSVLAPLLFLFVIDDLQDPLPEGVHSSLFADDSALWVHSPRKEDAGRHERSLSMGAGKGARCPSFLQIPMRQNGDQLWKSKKCDLRSILTLCS
jgi:hypothetical protein